MQFWWIYFVLNFLVYVFVGLSVSHAVLLGVDSGVDSYSGHILLSKLLRTFSLSYRRNPLIFRKNLLQLVFHLFYAT